MKKVFLLLILIASLLQTADAQMRDDFIPRETLRQFLTEISGIRAKDYIQTIARFNRTDGAFEGTGYQKAVTFVMDLLQEKGVENVTLLKYRSDGTTAYGTWRSNPGFKVKYARLYLTEPGRAKWCDFAEVPVSLMPYSSGKGTYEGEVVYINRGLSPKDYENIDLKGKIVFTDRSSAVHVMREAVVKRGALGIIMGASGSTDKSAYPTLVELNRMYITGEEMQNTTWGFSLSKRQTETLKSLLQRGRTVKMRAEIDAETFAGEMPIITAVIPGSTYPEQEVVFMAHLDHYKPGANDNASGSAGLLEIITTLNSLIKDKKIASPQRTLRFLWLPEQQGTAAYMANNLKTAKRGVAGINLDMIGEDYTKCGTKMLITRAPLSRPTFLNALFEHYAQYIDRLNINTKTGTNNVFNYRIIDYWGESDHTFFNDSDVGVAATMVVHFPERFWHTSMDTPDKVDPTELERSIFLGLFVGWSAATYTKEHVPALVEKTQTNLENKTGEYTARYRETLNQSPDNLLTENYRNIERYYDFLLQYGIRSFENIVQFVDGKNIGTIISANSELLTRFFNLQKDRIKNIYRQECSVRNLKENDYTEPELVKECKAIYPRRKVFLSLSVDLFRQLPPVMNYDTVWEAINFCDGKNSLYDIRNYISAEYSEVRLHGVKAVFAKLKELGLVTY